MAEEVSGELMEVLRDASSGLYAGQCDDPAALDEAIKRDLVRRCYGGAAGFIGLAKLELTPRGQLAIADGVIYGR